MVGVVDSGVYYNHPDLAGNIWADPLPFDFKFTYTDGTDFERDVSSIEALKELHKQVERLVEHITSITT